MRESLFGQLSGSIKSIRDRYWTKCAYSLKSRKKVFAILELCLIGIWALYVGRDYLDFDPKVIPVGREFLSSIQTHHVWDQIQDCGLCSLWNGSVRGGYPAFVDLHGSMLHPLVMVATLIWGIINGAKLTLVASFWLAGVAQWWIARELKVGWIPRIWSALLAVVGGHLAGRMELGVFGVVLSTSMCSLVFPGILRLAREGSRRSVVLLAVVMTSALLAGQGYIQVGLITALPAILVLITDDELQFIPLLKNHLKAVGLTVLLVAYFLVPLAHFLPNFYKGTDPDFNSAQSITYLPLNLVINDHGFYLNGSLGKLPYPYLYVLYIGWTAVILAVVGLALVRPKDRGRIYFLATGAVLVFLGASAVLLKWGVKILPALAGIRNPSLIAGVAIPLILGLAAYGLDRLLSLDWPVLSIKHRAWSSISSQTFSFRWLLLIPLILNLRAANIFSQHWLYTARLDDNLYALLEGLKTPSLQWVQTPFGEHGYIAPAMSMNLKLSTGIRAWNWKDREFPIPVLEANRAGPPPGPVRKVDEIDGISIYARDDQSYAAVIINGGMEPCVATGSGGWIEVTCDNSVDGYLEVKENMWNGWKAYRDGRSVQLLDDHWLQVDAPSGEHTYLFRYLPWDVPVGVALSAIGILICGWMWWRPSEGMESTLRIQSN